MLRRTGSLRHTALFPILAVAGLGLASPSTRAAAPQVHEGPQGALTVTGQKIGLQFRGDGPIQFLWVPTGQVFANMGYSWVYPYAYNPDVGEDPAVLDKRTHSSGDRSTTVTETWVHERGGFEQRLEFTVFDDQPVVRIRTAAVNRTAGARRVYMALRPASPQDLGEPDRGIIFHQKLDKYPVNIDLAQTPVRAVWGTTSFSPEYLTETVTGSDLFLPLACSVNSERRVGMLLMADPRASFGFQLESGRGGQGWNHIFYLPAAVGGEDDGIDYGPGIGKVHYDMYLGFVEGPSWEKIYWDYYLETFPELKTPPVVDAGRALCAGIGGLLWDAKQARRIAGYGIEWAGLADLRTRDRKVEAFNLYDTSLARRFGMKTLASMAIREGKDTERYPDFDPAYDWRQFEELLTKGTDGNPQPCWDGMSVNPSPEFAFGKAWLDRMAQVITDHGFDGQFTDFYSEGIGVDYGRPYQQFPFYPHQVAESRFAKAQADWLHARGKLYWINWPHPALTISPFADVVSYDGPEELAFWWKLCNPGRPVVALCGSKPPDNTWEGWKQAGMQAMFFGAAVPASAFTKTGSDLMNNVQYIREGDAAAPNFAMYGLLSSELAYADLVGGEPFNYFFFRGRDGLAFVTARNRSDAPVTYSFKLPAERMGLDPATAYGVSIFNLDTGPAAAMDRFTGAQLRDEGFSATLQPGETRIYIICPEDALGTLDLLKPFEVHEDQTVQPTARHEIPPPVAHEADFDNGSVDEQFWALPEAGKVEFADGALHLQAQPGAAEVHLTTRDPLPNEHYVLDLDFQPLSDENDGYGITFSHEFPEQKSQLWYLEGMGDGRLMVYTFRTQWGGMAGGGPIPLDRWYHLHVENWPTDTTIVVSDRETGEEFLRDNVVHAEGEGGRLLLGVNGGVPKVASTKGVRLDNLVLRTE